MPTRRGDVKPISARLERAVRIPATILAADQRPGHLRREAARRGVRALGVALKVDGLRGARRNRILQTSVRSTPLCFSVFCGTLSAQKTETVSIYPPAQVLRQRSADPALAGRKPTKMDAANEEDVDLDVVNLINLTAVPDVVIGQDRRPPVRGSPVIALFICIPLLLLLCRYRQAVMPFLRWSRSFPLRRHLGGRGRYESVSQNDLPSLNA